MKDKVIEILKEFEKEAHKSAIGYPDPSHDKFASRIDTLYLEDYEKRITKIEDSMYTPEISDGEIDKLAEKHSAEILPHEKEGSPGRLGLEVGFIDGYKAAIQREEYLKSKEK